MSRLHLPRAALLLIGAVALAVIFVTPQVPARAQEPAPLTIEVSLDPPAATLGDRVRLVVRVTHDAEVRVTVAPPRATSDLVLVSQDAPVTQPGDTPEATTEFAFTLAAFQTGPIALGSVEVSWVRADGASGSESVVLPTLVIESLVPPFETELRPLKPQAEIGGAPAAWQRDEVAVAAAAGSALVLAGLLALWLRSRRHPLSAPRADTAIEDAARRELQAIGAAGHLARGEFDEYYGRISLAVRQYLAARFGFPAIALTTTELRSRMPGRGVERWQARLVQGLLERCDAAVYAHRYPDPASADHDLTVALEIVEITREQLAGAPVPPATEEIRA